MIHLQTIKHFITHLTRKQIFLSIGGIILLLVLKSIFFGSSGQKTTYETTTLTEHKVQKIVSVVGSVDSDKSTSLGFETSGTITAIKVKEGQEVSTGTILATLDTTDIELEIASKNAALTIEQATFDKLKAGLSPEERNILDATIAKAQASANGLKNQISASKAKNKEDIAIAQLQLDNAKNLWEKTKSAKGTANTADISALQSIVSGAQTALEKVRKANAESIKNAEAAVKSAEQSLINAKNAEATGSPISDKNVTDKQETSFYDASKYLTEVDNTLTEINKIITVEDFNKDTNAAYKNQLGAKKLNSYNDTISGYNALKDIYVPNKTLFQVTGNVLSYNEILKRMDTLKNLLQQSHRLLTQTIDMLDNTVTSRDLTDTGLAGFKTAILNQRNTISTSISALATLRQTVENLELSKNSSNSGLSGAVSTAEKSLDAARQSLELTKANASSSETQAQNTYNQAVENLKKTKVGQSVADLDILRLEQSYQEAQRNLTDVTARVRENEATLSRTLIDVESEVTNTAVQKASKVAPARVEDVLIQQAKVDNAKKSLEISEEKKMKTELLSPKSGVVSKINFAVGEQVQIGNPVMIIINPNINTIKANIAETDIAQIKIGQKVEFDFDAFSEEEKYTGEVSYISPDKISLDGVVYYEVKIIFDPYTYIEKIVRPGFSANLNIIVDELTALSLPNQAVFEKSDGKSYVKIMQDEKPVEKEVVLGLVGDDYTEILDGVKNEDKVITLTVDKK